MFKLPHQEWLEKQPKHTQEWLKKQAIWHDTDMIKMLVLGIVIGSLLGLLW
jgi:hypothetical protein